MEQSQTPDSRAFPRKDRRPRLSLSRSSETGPPHALSAFRAPVGFDAIAMASQCTGELCISSAALCSLGRDRLVAQRALQRALWETLLSLEQSTSARAMVAPCGSGQCVSSTPLHRDLLPAFIVSGACAALLSQERQEPSNRENGCGEGYPCSGVARLEDSCTRR